MSLFKRRNFAPGPGARLHIGERVRITRGQFKGRTGVVYLKVGSMFDVRLDGEVQRRNIHRTCLVSIDEGRVG